MVSRPLFDSDGESVDSADSVACLTVPSGCAAGWSALVVATVCLAECSPALVSSCVAFDASTDACLVCVVSVREVPEPASGAAAHI